MFLEKVEFNKLGLQVVGVEELDYEQLDAAIEEFQCSEDLMAEIDSEIIKVVCTMTDINYSELVDSMKKRAHTISELNCLTTDGMKLDFWSDDLNNSMAKLREFFWWSLEYNYSEDPEFPAVSMFMKVTDFNKTADAYYTELERISSDFDNELISFDESEIANQAAYEKFGCNIYHDKYLNYKNLIDCDAADKIIKDDNHVFGEMKLYIQDEKNSDFHLSIMNIKKALSELYEI